MAIQARELLVKTTEAAKLRITPRYAAPKTFAASGGASAVELKIGNLVAYNTSTNLWVPWDPAGANGVNIIKGIVIEPFTIKATGGGEVIGSVMLRGEAHYGDLTAVTGITATGTDIQTALQGNSLREQGINIEGLDKIR